MISAIFWMVVGAMVYKYRNVILEKLVDLYAKYIMKKEG